MNENRFLYLTSACSILGLVLLYLLLPTKLEIQKDSTELEGEISYFVVKEKLTMVYVKPTKEIPVIIYDDVKQNVGDKIIAKGKFDTFNNQLQFLAREMEKKK